MRSSSCLFGLSLITIPFLIGDRLNKQGGESGSSEDQSSEGEQWI